jgi:hypothetical protein
MKSGHSALVLLGCLVLAACGTDKAASPGGGTPHDHNGTKPTINVNLEVSGNTLKVNVETDLHISPEHYGQARQEGEGHIHMYLDNGEKIGVKEGHKEFPNLEPGDHMLKVSLHNNDHTPYDVTESFPFQIQ